MRNLILDRVVCHEPDRYFSLDSDIFLQDPKTISSLVELTIEKPAAAPLCFMVPVYGPDSQRFPNVMTWSGEHGGPAYRDNYELGTTFRADVIMASVMMTKPVFENVRYKYHRQGEDLGWSSECARKGFELWSASQLYAAHVMYKDDLPDYLANGDHRHALDTEVC